MFSRPTLPICPHLHHMRRSALQAELPNHPTYLQPYDRSLLRDLCIHTHTHNLLPLITSLTSGFDIGYHGPHRDIRSPNLPSAYEHLTVVDTYLSSECAAGRMAGPFRDPPFTCSGLGAIPKQDGTWRVITHLSAPAGWSVNDYIDPEEVTLSYTTIDDAVSIAAKLGRGSLLAKIDLKQAFRQCPVRPADWHLLGLVWKGRYYYDKRLPFGLRSSPFLFNTVASALEYICRTQLDNRHIIHYLDDFLIAGPPHSSSCMDTLQGVEALCRELGIQTKDEKRTLPATAITFLGIHIHTVAQTISVPTEKLAAMLQELAPNVPSSHVDYMMFLYASNVLLKETDRKCSCGMSCTKYAKHFLSSGCTHKWTVLFQYSSQLTGSVFRLTLCIYIPTPPHMIILIFKVLYSYTVYVV